MKECSKGHAQRGREWDAAKNGLPAPHHEEKIQTVPIAWHVLLISTYRVLLLQALDNLNLVNVYILVLQAS